MSRNLIGRMLMGRFRVDAFLDAGGMGSVYRVWDTHRATSLAIKVLHGDFADDPAARTIFDRDAEALQKLDHPHIVRFFGAYQTDEGENFLVMQMIDGWSLKEALKELRGPVPQREALTYLKAISSALAYAHKSGLVHCDIKPANILIDKGGSVYVTDFGIARHADSSMTSLLRHAGTAGYISPEQCKGEPVSPRTDVYSAGVLFYEIVTGRRPFVVDQSDTSRSSDQQMRDAHIGTPAPDPRQFNPAISEGLALAMLKALAKNPRERFDSMQAFMEAVCAASNVKPQQVPDRVKATLPTEPESTFIEPPRSAASPAEQSTLIEGPPTPHTPYPPISAPAFATDVPGGSGRRAGLGIGIGVGLGIMALLAVICVAGVVVIGSMLRTPAAPEESTVDTEPGNAGIVPAAGDDEDQEPTRRPPTSTPRPEPTDRPTATTRPTEAPTGPVLENLRFCLTNCEAGGAADVNFPAGTKEVFYSFDYSGMERGTEYVREWTQDGDVWVSYRCVWGGPESGTFSKALFDRDLGLRSGTWTFRFVVEGEVKLEADIFIGGGNRNWSPIGTTSPCPDW